jgi:hypothetical protein
MLDYSLIPEHCRGGMRRYIEHGIYPGSFLEAVLCNDLVHAFQTADHINVAHMYDYVSFLYNEIPAQAWGSRERIDAWCNAGGAIGLDIDQLIKERVND